MTEFILTVNETSGGDFSSLTSWEAAIQADLTAAASKVFAVSSIANDGIADGEACTGQTSGATGTFKHLKADDSQCFILVLTSTFQAEVIEQDSNTAKTVTTSDTGTQITRATAQVSSDSELSDAVIVDGWTLDNTHDILITAMPGQSFQDHADVRTNKLDYDATKGAAILSTGGFADTIRNSEGGTFNFNITKLQLKATATTSRAQLNSNAGPTTLKDCIFESNSSDQTGSNPKFIINCLVKNVGTGDGLKLSFDGHAITTTVVKPSSGSGGIGIESNDGNNSDCVDCCSFGFDTDYSGTFDTGNSSNNASDSTGNPGSASQDSLTYADQFESAADDWRAKDGSLDANGVADETNAPEDISGQDRDGSAPTIGCWEFVAAVGFVPYPNPRYALTGGMQPMQGGI